MSASDCCRLFEVRDIRCSIATAARALFHLIARVDSAYRCAYATGSDEWSRDVWSGNHLLWQWWRHRYIARFCCRWFDAFKTHIFTTDAEIAKKCSSTDFQQEALVLLRGSQSHLLIYSFKRKSAFWCLFVLMHNSRTARSLRGV